jgi:cation diffusion facilitator CzcD-associated flavoprotein CzcO
MHNHSSTKNHYRVVIIGAGFGGMALAAKLKNAGIQDFVILERAASVGGVWRENTYPGAACDIPSRLYSLSIAPTTHWTRRYPSQPEIKRYAESLPARLELESFIRFNTNVLRMQWQANDQCWSIQTQEQTISAQFLVTANGGLESPSLPDIPGLAQFAGIVAHTAQWPKNLSLIGKRVALVGTGASAIQAGPAISTQASQLDIYQRTAPWVIPRFDRKVSTPMKWALNTLPGLTHLLRALVYAAHELRVLAFMNTAVMKLGQKLLSVWITSTVKDAAVARQAIPNYVLGCKRILISSDWYKMLNRPNVTLISNAVKAVNSTTLTDSNDIARQYDVIILATGFKVTDNPFGKTVIGLKGQSLNQVINGDGLYLGMTSDHLPNYFAMAGNNSATGHNSQIFMLECMADYICAGIKAVAAPVLRLKPNIAGPFNVQVQERLRSSVWRSGCQSWYQNAQGKVLVIWPGFTWRFWQKTRRFDKENYEQP